MTLVTYTSIEIRENAEPMVNLSLFGFVLDPRYFSEGLSTEKRMHLREGIANKLVRVQKNLAPLRLKIWDGYRSREVQKNLYKKCWNGFAAMYPRWSKKQINNEAGKFITPPFEKNRIPPHSTGGSVDLTLADKNGNGLFMGTDFDHFGPESHPYYFETHEDKNEAKKNREILREAMFTEGFTTDENEWWHFDFGNQLWALNSNNPFAVYGEVNPNFLSK